jgi:predicted RNA binding protein YcfA (HicA-like mRNA interferase family)
MTKLPILSSKQLIQALRTTGFYDAPKRGKGSHIAMVKRTPTGVLSLPAVSFKGLSKGRRRAVTRNS